MNNLLEELVNQAGSIQDPSEGIPVFNKEKFAKLVAKKCAEICEADYNRNGNYGAGWRLAREIEELFDIK